MNKELKILNNSAIVVDENNKERELTLTHNLEDILVTENNIQYIKKELEKIDFECKHVTSNNKLIKFINAIGISAITIICSILGMNNIAALLVMPVLLATTVGCAAFVFNNNIKYKDKLKLKESILKNSFIEESIKLKELKINSKKINNQEIKRKKINTSACLKNLKRKLELIEDYQLMKKNLIKDYDYNLLLQKLLNTGYSESDVEFIQILMEQDIKEKEEKQKTLNLKKNKR
ncbi:MAG: hypothetical protein IJY25_00335 [Bacilli bacterium]|nr:hypothetical protein [Bacilli bacterium]